MRDPLLGDLAFADGIGWYESEPRPIRFLRGQICRFVIEDCGPDEQAQLEVQRAVKHALEAGDEVLAAAEPYVVQYCEDVLEQLPDGDRPHVQLEKPGDVWSYVYFGTDLRVSRRAKGDVEDGVYLEIECGCEWEQEHGMQLVFRDGNTISKVSPYDGHRTNVDAYGDPKLVGVVYVPM